MRSRGLVAVFREADNPDKLQSLQGRFPGKLVLVEGDVGEEATAPAFTGTALQNFGRHDILVNNAAVSVVKALHIHTPEEWDAVSVPSFEWIYGPDGIESAPILLPRRGRVGHRSVEGRAEPVSPIRSVSRSLFQMS